ncbi:hypothetical protein I316_04572 [Kwoniella heveanensis BCC8398]|uniref:Uncharacterized protein n=1 Tax=Kwoniella heveanensis BCC8398 TaxID=1296120 RepID=A0A1B9GS13_9TREE|nr:hypothetical protein I316_04572 [Kwoniella heveanensis BCC8398]
MSFSLFTLNQSTCQPAFPDHMLPSCPLLTFDLTLLHLLSITSFVQLLMILSSILSSSSSGLLKNGDAGGGEGFVMWELALASPPASPPLKPQRSLRSSGRTAGSPTNSSTVAGVRSYGATSTKPQPFSALELSSSTRDLTMPGSPHEPSMARSHIGTASTSTSIGKKDKFAIARLRTYIPLSIASLCVGCGAIAANLIGESAPSGIFLAVVAFSATLLSIACISTHFAQRKEMSYDPLEEGAEYSYRRARLVRAMEVAAAGILFILWPVAAISFSLSPPSPTRACTNPAASAIPSPGEDSDIDGYPLCKLGWTIISLSWVGSWLLLVRIMGLIFPMPPGLSTGEGASTSGAKSGSGPHPTRSTREEGRALLGGNFKHTEESGIADARAVRTDASAGPSGLGRKGWQRVVAGEEFELGSDDDDDDDDDDDKDADRHGTSRR